MRRPRNILTGWGFVNRNSGNNVLVIRLLCEYLCCIAGFAGDFVLNSRPTPIWDLPTRLFHWSLLPLLAASWASAEFDRLDIHEWCGYTEVPARFSPVICPETLRLKGFDRVSLFEIC